MAPWRVSPTLAGALWLKTNLIAERHTRDVPRVFIDYANLVEDWQREMERISAVYEALRGAAQDDPLHVSTLDRVFESYQAAERDFRVAFTEFHARTNSVVRRVFRPFIVKRILEVAAMLHRRRGAWA
jgi:chlorite dismutase